MELATLRGRLLGGTNRVCGVSWVMSAVEVVLSEGDGGGGLFRQEVIDAQGRRLHGAVILQQSVSSRILTAGIILIVAVALLWLVLGRYARTETAKGILVPVGGAPKIVALRPGVVTSLTVREGDRVRAGQQLAVVSVETPNARGGIVTNEELNSNGNQTELAIRQIEISRRRSASEVERLGAVVEGLRQQSTTIADQLQLQQEMVTSTSTNFERITAVVERGYVSNLELERRRQAMLAARQELSRLRQQAAAIAAEIRRTEQERLRATLDGQNDQANATRAVEELQQQRSRITASASYSIEAPISGRVASLQTAPGNTVTASMPLMVIVPDEAELRAELFVPSRAIGFIRVGQEVRLLYDAFPYQRFGSHEARVIAISRVAMAGPETNAPFTIEEPVYRVTARLQRQQLEAFGQTTQLQPGMTLVANVILDRQSFLDWMLAPVRAVGRRY